MKENGQSDAEFDTNRRNILKKIGGVGVGGVALYSRGVKGKSEIGAVQQNVAQSETLETVFKSGKYQKFISNLKEAYGVEPNIEEANSHRVTSPEEEESYIADIPLTGIPEGDKSGIAAIVKDGNVTTVKASSTENTSESTKVVTWYKLSKGEIETFEQTVSMNEKISSAGTMDDSVGTTGLAPSECEVCKAAFNTILAIGCSASVSVICAAVAVALTGGSGAVACAGIAPAICANSNNLSAYTPEEYCKGTVAGQDLELDYC